MILYGLFLGLGFFLSKKKRGYPFNCLHQIYASRLASDTKRAIWTVHFFANSSSVNLLADSRARSRTERGSGCDKAFS